MGDGSVFSLHVASRLGRAVRVREYSVQEYPRKYRQVLILSITILATGYQWAYALLTYGFLARVLTGPTLSPMGLLATRVLLPLLGNPDPPLPGPPKRFAQTIGLIF